MTKISKPECIEEGLREKFIGLVEDGEGGEILYLDYDTSGHKFYEITEFEHQGAVTFGNSKYPTRTYYILYPTKNNENDVAYLFVIVKNKEGKKVLKNINDYELVALVEEEYNRINNFQKTK